jgi:hypothetical protein
VWRGVADERPDCDASDALRRRNLGEPEGCAARVWLPLMSSAVPIVLALLPDPRSAEACALAAAFEEEGVPLVIEAAAGPRLELARRAAAAASLGHGVGADDDALALVLAAHPGAAYLEAPIADARAFGHAAARLVSRRPLRSSTSTA